MYLFPKRLYFSFGQTVEKISKLMHASNKGEIIVYFICNA